MTDTYNAAAQATARLVMQRFSTSFGLASRLFDSSIRQDIYNVYGLVRVADEIVDSYLGSDARAQLDALETEVYAAVSSGFSTNLIVHAYCLSARKYTIDNALVKAFFASMRMDLTPETYKTTEYETYIYGSAEVIGLMCLAVFCQGDAAQYAELSPGASALGAAFQKVNFLRDMAADHELLGRYYFPVGTYEGFDETTKLAIITDIKADFVIARNAIGQLPATAQPAVRAAYRYFLELLNKLGDTPAAEIKTTRIRVSNKRKLQILLGVQLRSKLKINTSSKHALL